MRNDHLWVGGTQGKTIVFGTSLLEGRTGIAPKLPKENPTSLPDRFCHPSKDSGQATNSDSSWVIFAVVQIQESVIIAESESFCNVGLKGCVKSQVKDNRKTKERSTKDLKDLI